MTTALCRALKLRYPIIQAPMAGVSTPELAAAVTEAGALGSISVGASTPEQAEKMILATQALTKGAINVNLFCHASPLRDPVLEQQWIAKFHDLFRHYDTTIPSELSEIYSTFNHNDPMLAVLLKTRPTAVSFHFGLPDVRMIEQLKALGIVTLASATSLNEAAEIEASGIDFVIAQGMEAGGHRGMFYPDQEDSMMSTFTLVQAIKQVSSLPVIAAGGIMDGAGIAAMQRIGAAGSQLGTAFILCPESAANPAYRAALKSELAQDTVFTSAISGRPARSLNNAFCKVTRDIPIQSIPAYPLTYALGKSLASAAAAKGEPGFAAQWAGQGAHLARELPAGQLVALLAAELIA
ncbi:nitronate monooxygenase family protein [uncultured Cedecea sp.]|uniref:NAD(P)H-dependent flavin oxidoreductase n=1 Tax=uncultured Cedecea sp. TaxID=988762 RepID=UPI002627D3DA|nr:nitronate monooxygenase [uncultured Cedecea sp.]